MSRTVAQNFTLRFGDPARIKVEFEPLSHGGPAEARYRKEKIFEAYTQLLRSLLGRPATDAEVFGLEPIKEATDQKEEGDGGIHKREGLSRVSA